MGCLKKEPCLDWCARWGGLISPQHGCWKWEQHLQPNTTVTHFMGFWHSVCLKKKKKAKQSPLPRKRSHGIKLQRSHKTSAAWELIFIGSNLWIHFSPTSYLFLLIRPRVLNVCRGGGSAVALAGHQCQSFIPLHTGLVLTPLAKFTDLTDCGLNAACLVFSTCPSRFATLAAQFSSNSNYSSARYACAGAPPLIRGDAGLGPRLAPSEGTSSEPVRACALSERWVTASLSESGEEQEEEGPVLTARCDVPSHACSTHTHTNHQALCLFA